MENRKHVKSSWTTKGKKQKKRKQEFLSLVTGPSGFSDNVLHFIDLGLGTANGTEL